MIYSSQWATNPFFECLIKKLFTLIRFDPTLFSIKFNYHKLVSVRTESIVVNQVKVIDVTVILLF
jgi:hypothetical protein